MAESDTSTTESGDEEFDNLPLDDENTTDEDWRMTEKGNDIYRHFMVEFVNNRKTNRRKCVKSGEVVQSINYGTSTMSKHKGRCNKQNSIKGCVYHINRREKLYTYNLKRYIQYH